MAARVFPVFLALTLAWHLPNQRAALGVAVLCLAITVVMTFVYIYPINAVLFERAGEGHSAVEISAMVQKWIWADRVRFAIGIIAFGAILWAFRLPLSG